jgi:hypothetical protein
MLSLRCGLESCADVSAVLTVSINNVNNIANILGIGADFDAYKVIDCFEKYKKNF